MTSSSSSPPSSSSPTLPRFSPSSSTSGSLKPSYGDRFIPQRMGNLWEMTYSSSPTPEFSLFKNEKDGDVENLNKTDGGSATIYSKLLKNEVLNYKIESNFESMLTEKRSNSARRKLFHFDSSSEGNDKPWTPSFSVSPISHSSKKLLQSPRIPPPKKICKEPYKVLDAKGLEPNFYMSLLDWSASQNVLAVGIESCVWLWVPSTQKVEKLCDISTPLPMWNTDGLVSSVAWHGSQNRLAVATTLGGYQVWDPKHSRRVSCSPKKHERSIGVMDWNGWVIASGSRDKSIHLNDIRPNPSGTKIQLNGHQGEICGLKWSPDKQYLASGGNDNRLLIWDIRKSVKPVQKYEGHLAAVKALAWSPHQHGLLASGGGTQDRTIKFWNTITGNMVRSVNTEAQVCNIAWSKHSSEFVSTHGFPRNNILIWKYPSLEKEAELMGHPDARVLFMTMSPDGKTIVTGSSVEHSQTLNFWKVFEKEKERTSVNGEKSRLNFQNKIR